MKMPDIYPILHSTPFWLLSLFTFSLISLIISSVMIMKNHADAQSSDDINERFSIIERRINEQSEKLDKILLVIESRKTLSLGDITLPEPNTDKHVGWHIVIKKTLNVDSLDNTDEKILNSVFSPILEPEALVNLVLNGKIEIKAIVLDKRSNNVVSDTKTDYEIAIDLKNIFSEKISALIPKGQVFENKDSESGFQNVVNAEEQIVNIEQGEHKIIYLPAYCLNQDLKSPEKNYGNITPLKVNFEFSEQNMVWNEIKNKVP